MARAQEQIEKLRAEFSQALGSENQALLHKTIIESFGECEPGSALKSGLKFIKAIEDMLVKLGKGSRRGRRQDRLKSHWKQLKELARG